MGYTMRRCDRQEGVLTHENARASRNRRGMEPLCSKHIPGVQNTLADGISRWPRSLLADKVKELTNSSDWHERPIGTRGSRIFGIVLQTKNMHSKHDDSLWNIMMNEAEHG